MNESLMRAFALVRNAPGLLLERTHSEHGVPVAQYALLVALGALVVSVLVGVLGSDYRTLFGEMHTCMTGIKTVACKVGPVLRESGSGSRP